MQQDQKFSEIIEGLGGLVQKQQKKQKGLQQLLEKEANHAINFNLPPEVEQLQAMVHYDLAFDVNEEVENQQLRRAQKQLTQDRCLDALETCNLVIDKNPKSSEAFFMRGQVYYGLEHVQKAEADYKLAIQLKKTNARAWLCLGKLYLKQYEFQKALNCFDELLKLQPGDEQGLAAKAEALFSIGDYQASLDCTQQAIVEKNLKQAKILYQAGKDLSAKQYLDIALEEQAAQYQFRQ